MAPALRACRTFASASFSMDRSSHPGSPPCCAKSATVPAFRSPCSRRGPTLQARPLPVRLRHARALLPGPLDVGWMAIAGACSTATPSFRLHSSPRTSQTCWRTSDNAKSPGARVMKDWSPALTIWHGWQRWNSTCFSTSAQAAPRRPWPGLRAVASGSFSMATLHARTPHQPASWKSCIAGRSLPRHCRCSTREPCARCCFLVRTPVR